ncbi:MAG: hypothetical protein J7J87_04730 [Candidatus Diapherotrites archaeon]|nr:hypothetical protein [Candidatus Diapherotrites archaeon]
MSLDKVVACLKALNFKPNIDNFEHRLIIQKLVYLLELKGVKTGFSYSLYVRGPYSSELTEQIYESRKKVENLVTSENLSNTELKYVQEFKELFRELRPSILEVAATYAFFAFDQKQDPLTALKNVKRMKPFYSEAQIAIGVSKAKEFLFTPTKKELNELKKELWPWQEASKKSMRS